MRGVARSLLGGASLRRIAGTGRKQRQQGDTAGTAQQRHMREGRIIATVGTSHLQQTPVVVARPEWPEGTAAGWPSLR